MTTATKIKVLVNVKTECGKWAYQIVLDGPHRLNPYRLLKNTGSELYVHWKDVGGFNSLAYALDSLADLVED